MRDTALNVRTFCILVTCCYCLQQLLLLNVNFKLNILWRRGLKFNPFALQEPARKYEKFFRPVGFYHATLPK